VAEQFLVPTQGERNGNLTALGVTTPISNINPTDIIRACLSILINTESVCLLRTRGMASCPPYYDDVQVGKIVYWCREDSTAVLNSKDRRVHC